MVADKSIINAESDYYRYGHSFTPLGYEQFTTVTAPVTLTPPDGSRFAIIQAVNTTVRYRDDGVSPDSTTGMRLIQDEEMAYRGDLDAIELIEESTGGEINVAYYG
jgi:hypothetical protein